MIEPMKKVTVLMSAASCEQSLEDLRRLGVVHIQHGARLGDDRLNLTKKLQLLRDALQTPPPNPLPQGEGERHHSLFHKTPLPLVGEGRGEGDERLTAGLTLASELLVLHREALRGERELADLRRQRDRQAVFGRCQPRDLQELQEAGVYVRLYACPRRDTRRYLGRAGVERIAVSGSAVYLALVSRDEQYHLPLREIAWPEASLDELEAHIAAAGQALAENRRQFAIRAAQVPLLRTAERDLLNAQHFAQAREAISSDAHIAGLQGFCPAIRLAELSRQAAASGWSLVIADPADTDPTPTLLRHSRFTALFQPVMDLLKLLPAYHEFDTNRLFLMFFTLFFAMILGDAGYGLLLLAATFTASRFVPIIPRSTLPLFYLLATATIIWGAITGLWFGVPQLAELPGLRSLVVPALNAFAANNELTLIHLCLTLGVIHLSLAHLWTAWRHRSSLPALADLGWMLVVWAAYLAAIQALAGVGSLTTAILLAAGGLLGVVLFSEQTETGFLCGVGLGLLNLPLHLLNAISSFSDIVSYLRLFAISLASKEVAVAFNRLALEVGFDSVFAAVGAALLILLGHSINLLLSALSVIVHGLRLNLLEFSRRLNLTWSGIPYQPFRRLTAGDDDPASSGPTTATRF